MCCSYGTKVYFLRTDGVVMDWWDFLVYGYVFDVDEDEEYEEEYDDEHEGVVNININIELGE